MKSRQGDFYQASFARLLPPSAKVLLAFSGGRDSTVLLHMLRYGWSGTPGNLRAVYVDHGMSPHAGQWARHCQALCAAWQVPLDVVRVRLVDDGQGLEARARKARYAAFARVLRSGERLVCAHHLDDQAETLLLALKRGSGPAGLAAMPESMAFAGGVLVRPLLGFSREQLADYARAHQLRWVDDESNQHDRYDRNFLRLRVLPSLGQRWPGFAAALARSAQLCGEQEQLLDELLAQEVADAVRPGGGIAIAPLRDMSRARRGAVLRRWLYGQGAQMPSRALLSRLWQEVALSRQDAKACLRLGDHVVRRFQGVLWRVALADAPPGEAIPWRAPFAPLCLPGGNGQLLLLREGGARQGALNVRQDMMERSVPLSVWVRPPAPDEVVSVRFHASGLWRIVGRARRRSLKKLWQELAVPPWLRGRIPLLFYAEQLIAAPGFFVAAAGAPVQENSWNISWRRAE